MGSFLKNKNKPQSFYNECKHFCKIAGHILYCAARKAVFKCIYILNQNRIGKRETFYMLSKPVNKKRLKYGLGLLTSLHMTSKLIFISQAVLSSTQDNALISISLNSYSK